MFGISLRLKFKTAPSNQQLMELQYNLMHRFGTGIFKMIADGGSRVPFVRIEESDNGESWVDIAVRGNYYNIGFEYGEGLAISSILLYLCQTYPGLEVWYCPETEKEVRDEEFIFDERKALKLLLHFVDHGSLPFLEALTRFQNRGGVNSPLCPFCGGEMMRDPGRINTANFSCAGCREEIRYEGSEYYKWKSDQKRLSASSDADDEYDCDEEAF